MKPEDKVDRPDEGWKQERRLLIEQPGVYIVTLGEGQTLEVSADSRVKRLDEDD